MDSQNDLDQFPPEVQDAVDGLAWLGHIEDTVRWCGHSFTLRTMKASEELEAALLAKEFADTFGQVKAHAWANIALALVAVDGDEDFCPPIGPDKRQYARALFNYVTENWYWPVGEYLFGQYVALIQRQARAIEAIENLSERSLRTSWPSQDSLSGQEGSEETSTDFNSDSSPISPEEMRKLASDDE